MANENLGTIKTKIAAADGISVTGPTSTALTNKQTALQAALAAKTAAEVDKANAITLRDQAVTLKNTAIAQRDNAIAALNDTSYYEALNAKDARITDLTNRLNALTAAVIEQEHTSLEAYKSKDMTRATIAAIAAQTVTGAAITPNPVVTLGGVTLTKNTHYTVSYSNNTAIGTATVTVTGIGQYFFSKSANFAIAAIQSSELTVEEIPNQTETGSALTPEPVVTYGTTTLVKGTDYTVSYADNTAVGTATVTITGIGNYTGTKTATFTIVAAD